MTATTIQPIFARISSDEKATYDHFFEYTDDANIQSYARGSSLEKLVDLAEAAYSIVEKTNPILQEGSPLSAIIPGKQWEINRLSEIKQRLAKAIDCKRSYYDNHLFGRIVKYVLQCFGMWNDGDTAAIIKAEDFMILYDSRLPLFKDSKGNYRTRCFFFLTQASWVRNHLDTSRFYNHNPRRVIPVVQTFRYDTLDPRNPQVLIRT